MTKLIQFAQLVTWLAVAAYFSILAAEKIKPKPVKSDIVAQLENQNNFEVSYAQ